jgi:hypothetical protein
VRVAAEGEGARLDEQAIGVVPVRDGSAVDADRGQPEVVVVGKADGAHHRAGPGGLGQERAVVGMVQAAVGGGDRGEVTDGIVAVAPGTGGKGQRGPAPGGVVGHGQGLPVGPVDPGQLPVAVVAVAGLRGGESGGGWGVVRR